MEDLELLREYAERRSEPAFTELLRRHVNLVYSAALRLLGEPEAITRSADTLSPTGGESRLEGEPPALTKEGKVMGRAATGCDRRASVGSEGRPRLQFGRWACRVSYPE